MTDAHLVLGRLDPDAFLDGELRLYPDLAQRAIAERVAGPLGCLVEVAARGIIAVTEANMAGAIRQTAARHGDDLREFVVVAAGGAGPLHAVALARELHMSTVCVPLAPGLLSALGLLTTDLRHDLTQPLLVFAEEVEPDELERAFGALEEKAHRRLADDAIRPDDRRLERGVDLRSVGQEYALTVPVTAGEPMAVIVGRFHETHERVYGHAAPDEPVETVAVRVVAWGAFPRPALAHLPTQRARQQPLRRRQTWFAEADGFVETAIHRRDELDADARLVGPAIVEQLDTTILVPPGYSARVVALDSLVIEASGAGA